MQMPCFWLLLAASNIVGIQAKRENIGVHVQNAKSYSSRGISYKQLTNAKAKYISVRDKSVKVEYGSSSARLSRNGVDPTVFNDVVWQQLDHSPLKQEDEDFINKYTGRFDYSRNVGVVLRGITPYTNGEDPTVQFVENKDHARLTEEVLQWIVGFANALNKLPNLNKPRPLWRGAWESREHIKLMEQLPHAYSVPWFQPMTSDKDYAPKFLQQMYEPLSCRDAGCIKSGSAFPVLYEFTTMQTKDLRKWNPDESEFMLLPNSAFRILSVTKITNDEFLEMDTQGLVDWLSSVRRPVDPKDERRLGPFPTLADAVSEAGWDGPKFLEEYDKGYGEIPTLPNGRPDYSNLRQNYLRQLALSDDTFPSNLQGDLVPALRNRYKLKPVMGRRGITSNSVPFYYEVKGESRHVTMPEPHHW